MKSIPPVPEPDPGGWNYAQLAPPFQPGKIGISLSGGGHRASMFALGAATAVHDSGLWPNVRWIASVSGGSFANGAIARHLPSHATTTDVDAVLRRATDIVCKVGALVGLTSRPATGDDVGVVGRLFERGIAKRWLAADGTTLVRLQDVATPDRVHVFMAVDLATLLPVFISDRGLFASGLDDENPVVVHPGPLGLARAIRASASFPGLPATRVTAADVGAPIEPIDHDLFLADGGLWNNLATTWAKQAQYISTAFPELGLESYTKDVDLHIVVDASSPATRPKGTQIGHGRRSLDRPGRSLYRAFLTASQSSLDAHRQMLSASGLDANVVRVDIDDAPGDVQPRGALLEGAARDEWHAVRVHNLEIGTALPTLMGISKGSALHLLAHGYAVAAAHLTVLGMPFEAFMEPYTRIRAALG